MKRIPVVIYSSPEEIEAMVRQLEMDALELPPDTDEHRNIMRQIAQFRIYADAKRWLSPSAQKRHA